MQEKYSDLSPFNFVANDPINILDVNGKDTIRFTRNTTVYTGFTPKLDGLSRISAGGNTTYGTTVIQAPGADVFEYVSTTAVISASGIKNLPPVKREFYPNNPSSNSGITTSPSTTGLLGDRKDPDFVALAKLSSPELLAYLRSHDSKYGGLGFVKEQYAEYEKATAYASTILLIAGIAEGGYGLLRSPGAITAEARFSQTTFGTKFSEEGAFKGEKVDDIARELKYSLLSPSDVPVQYIMRDGNQLILNTRSSAALTKAGIPRSKWIGVDVTGNSFFEGQLNKQLSNNKLTNSGTVTTRQANSNIVIGPNGIQ